MVLLLLWAWCELLLWLLLQLRQAAERHAGFLHAG
jgi:hypothetical protein